MLYVPLIGIDPTRRQQWAGRSTSALWTCHPLSAVILCPTFNTMIRRPKMKPLKQDLSIFNKFNFEKPPVGVKFLFFRPEGMKQLSMDKNLSFCEMLKEAQQSKTPFYFGNHGQITYSINTSRNLKKTL
jgi:hypothetical protein